MKLRILLADDEPIARMRLKTMLERETDTEVVVMCGDGRELCERVTAHMPDLVLTDIDMPGLDGFEAVLQILNTRTPLIAFVTAHPQYAARAFEIQALDYLVKPVEQARLRDCLNRALVAQQARIADRNSNSSQSYRVSFLVVEHAMHTVLPVAGVGWIEAADYYAYLHAGGRQFAIREPLQRIADSLDPMQFRRVHRSAIVNLKSVRSLIRLGQGGRHVVLNSGKTIKVSDRFWAELVKGMSQSECR